MIEIKKANKGRTKEGGKNKGNEQELTIEMYV